MIIGTVIGTAAGIVVVVGLAAGSLFPGWTPGAGIGTEPGPAARLVAQGEGLTSLQAATGGSPRADTLTVSGAVNDVRLSGERIEVAVFERPGSGVLVRAAFDRQAWEEVLREVSVGDRVRVSGVSAVATGGGLVDMDGTGIERLGEAGP